MSGVLEELQAYAAPALNEQPMPGFLKYAPSRVLKVGTSSLIAAARYRPGFYPGELTLFRAVAREERCDSLEEVWRKHARSLRIVETAGTHSAMLSVPNAECAASLLTQLLPGFAK